MPPSRHPFPTGPWSRRWIQKGYPTKNFHVKGKSSDWGPQAGFVPYLGKYSKVGRDTTKAAKSTRANDDGIHESFAATTQLELGIADLRLQLLVPEENPQRNAIHRMLPCPSNRSDSFLFARRSGDNLEFAFRACLNPRTARYLIYVYDEGSPLNDLARLEWTHPNPLLVMTSSEVGANNRPMTGDYDLMAVCPTWGNYMERSTRAIEKSAVQFDGKHGQVGQRFEAGQFMDKVLDMRMSTGAITLRDENGATTHQGITADSHNNAFKGGQGIGKLDEHGDMGNLTPRILRCINELNREMNPRDADTPFRRVHHNAESHRHSIFGALQGGEMHTGEGFPMTAFHPGALSNRAGWPYYDVATLENMGEFGRYCDRLNRAGYYVPRNAAWGMSVRDRVRAAEQSLGII